MPLRNKNASTLRRATRKRARVMKDARSITARPSQVRLTRPVQLGKQMLPDRLVNKLKYVVHQAIPLSAGAGELTYRANGMFDPEFALGGHQPLGFDQMTAIYDHFTVLNSSIRVTALPASVLGGTLTMAITDSSATASLYPLMEGPKHKNLIHNDVTLCQGTMYWNGKQMFGDNMENNTLYRGNASGDPTEQAYFKVKYFDPNLAATTIMLLVEIEYTAMWSELKVLPQS